MRFIWEDIDFGIDKRKEMLSVKLFQESILSLLHNV
jgi:hypothetical protein